MTMWQTQRTPVDHAQPDDAAALRLLEDLVAIPSISGDEGAAVSYLVAQMAALGFTAHTDAAGNAVGSIGTGRPETVLLGHIDTVPGAIPVRRVDGRLYGRGTVDAKGPLAAFVIAAARLHAQGRLRGRIVVIGCVEEEAPSSRGAHHVVARYRPDLCVVGEPSGWNRVTLGYKGVLRITCRYAGAGAHSAHNQQTAPERISALWQRIVAHAAAFNADRERAFDHLLPTLLRINSGGDGLSEWATAEISIRLPLDVQPQALAEIIRALDPQVELRVLGATPAFRAERSTPLVRALTQAIRGQTAQPGLVLKTGTADMNIVGPAWSCPIVAYGPGDAALDHTPEEHIVLDEYLSAIRVLETAFARLHE
ncbi:MAG TPA: [LysW]-lysine hydrolase [Herpetosiphonaceae bacterium]